MKIGWSSGIDFTFDFGIRHLKRGRICVFNPNDMPNFPQGLLLSYYLVIMELHYSGNREYILTVYFF